MASKGFSRLGNAPVVPTDWDDSDDVGDADEQCRPLPRTLPVEVIDDNGVAEPLFGFGRLVPLERVANDNWYSWLDYCAAKERKELFRFRKVERKRARTALVELGVCPDVIVGYDSEYQCQQAEVIDQSTNNVICYQMVLKLPDGRSFPKIWHMPGDDSRMTLAELLGELFIAAKAANFFKWFPGNIHLAAHFAVADIASLEGGRELMSDLNALRRTLVSMKDPLSVVWTDGNRNQRTVKVNLVDTMLLAPSKAKKLADIGRIVGIPKIELPPGAIERMGEYRQAHPDEFNAYAVNDAVIAAEYATLMWRQSHDMTGSSKMPKTLGGMAVNYSVNTWKAANYNWQERLQGMEEHVEEVYNDELGRTVKRKKLVKTVNRSRHESFAAECTHGGRNEAFLFGTTTVGDWIDIDLCAAYTTAMACLGEPAWERMRPSRDLEDFQPATLGMAYVQFRFPDSVRYPCLPVRTGMGLI